MKSRYGGTWSSNMGDIDNHNAEMVLLRYVVSDLDKYSTIGYPNIWVPIEITTCNLYDGFAIGFPISRSDKIMKSLQ